MSGRRRLRAVVAAGALLTLGACETESFVPPPVSEVVGRTGSNVQTLAEGRALFIDRCIDCHVLPPIAEYSPEELRGIVPKMAHRAHLQPAEEQAVLSYILAARGG